MYKTFNIESMFNLYPANEKELKFKSNIVDVAHFVGYRNVKKGKNDKKILEIAYKLYENDIYLYDAFDNWLKANNSELIKTLEKISELFSIEITHDAPNNNKKLYKIIKELIKDIYNKRSVNNEINKSEF